MGKTEDTQWHCLNRDCGWSAVMSINVEEAAPRCVCGSPMQRSVMAPVMSSFDFLRGMIRSAPMVREKRSERSWAWSRS